MNYREFIKKTYPIKHPTPIRYIPPKHKNGKIDWANVPLGTQIIARDWAGNTFKGTLTSVHPRILQLSIPNHNRPFYCLRSEVIRVG